MTTGLLKQPPSGIIKRKLRSDKKVPEKRPGSDGVVSNKEVPFSNQKKMGETVC